MINIVFVTKEIFLQQFLRKQPLRVRFESCNNSCKVFHPNLSNIPFKCLLNAI